MFEQMPAPKPWYRSWQGLLFAGGGVAAALLVVLLIYLIGSREDPNTEAHYAALERHRAEQQKQAPPADPALAQTAEQQPAGEQQPAQGEQAAAGAAQGEASAAQPGSQPAAQGRARRNYWTQFRGPARDGRYDERPVKTDWPSGGLAPLWRQPIGGGYSSFSVADGVAYTIEQRRSQEVVTAYQVETGRELWAHGWNAVFREQTGDGPRSTPTWDSGRLYALGATGELRCLDARSGRPIWSKNILTENGASNLQWGMAASPLVVDDKVVVMPGGSNGRTVVAYDKATGALRWKSMSGAASYTSPMLVTLAGRRQILVVTGGQVAGLAPEDGAVLWGFPWSNSAGINVSQPIVAGPNRFFISAGYGKGAALVEVSPAGRGLSARAVWESPRMKNKFNSSVLHDGHVYGLDEGVLSCMELATGEVKWKARGYGYGQVVLASGHLIITTEEGEVALVRAAPGAHAEVARFSALEGRTWNVPAIADGRLLVRNATQMACYKLAD